MSSPISFRNLGFDKASRLRGRAVFRAAFKHTLANKQIFLVPLISTAIGAGLTVWFIGSLFVTVTSAQGFQNYANFFVSAFFIIVFVFMSSLILLQAISEATVLVMANNILGGTEGSISLALTQALRHFPKLVIFAMWNLIVGTFLRVLQRSFLGSFIGDAVAFLGGLAWVAATYFTLPGVVFEGLGPIEATKRSVQTLKEKWGEAASPAVFASGIIVALYLAGSALLFGPIWLGPYLFDTALGAAATPVLGAAMVIGLIILFITGMLQATTMSFVKMAIYRYVKGQPVLGLDQETLHGAMSTASRFSIRRRPNGTV